ncbi:MAG: GIY-YIG nuclease family protein [Rhodothermales bacterium]|nr:GIY-YIG nuclease family protein [Rhodothermales bacterium]
MINGVYIGQTVKRAQDRWKEHVRAAGDFSRRSKGNGALYEVIRAFGPDGFVVEEVAEADTQAELNALETRFIKEYDSVENGLNRVAAPSTRRDLAEAGTITIRDEAFSYSSKADLCRQLEVSYSTLQHWLGKGLSLEKASEQALRAREDTEGEFEVFRKRYRSYTELAADKKLNRHGLSGRQIAARVRSGMTIREAVSTPKRPKGISVEVEVGGEQRTFDNAAEAYRKLSADRTLPAYSAVIQRLEAGETAEEAFGLAPRPWMAKHGDVLALVEEEGYQLLGELKPWSQPVVVEHTKEVFASKKAFAREFGLEYTEVARKLKAGASVFDLLRESGHID